jgi:hypothetical protein
LGIINPSLLMQGVATQSQAGWSVKRKANPGPDS